MWYGSVHQAESSDEKSSLLFCCLKWGYRTFCVFFMLINLVFIRLYWRNKGVLPRGKSSCLEIRRISLFKATRSAFNIEKVLSVFEPAFLFCYN